LDRALDHRKDPTEKSRLLPGTVVIDGGTLQHVLASDGESLALLPPAQAFFELAMLCASVVVCRCSPLQKALVVDLVRTLDNGAITLAVGDGANDVSMIRTANIGVGIRGEEGMQAAQTADYAIHKFRDLDRLLLHHGRLSYVRLVSLIKYNPKPSPSPSP
jgi:magnesium-transporting ATPase (P-type)